MGRIRFLSNEDIEIIHNMSLEILDKTGVVLKNENIRELLEQEGCAIDSERVRIPNHIIETSIKDVPESFQIFTRDGTQSTCVGGDNVIFNPGSSANFFLDSETGEIRNVTSNDLVQLVRLVDSLEHIHAQSTAVGPSDVPTEILDLFRLYVVLRNSGKPIITGAFTKQGLLDMKQMLEAVVGGPESLAQKPRAVFDCCPSSALIWGDVTSQNLVDCAKFGIPAAIVPAPLMGGTSPITLSGTLAQANAEILSGIVISQLTNRGAPVVYGGAIGTLDMKHGTNRIGAIETAMVACASAEMGKHYGIPTQAYLGLSDSKALDAQSGIETSMGIFFAAMARINIVSGPGMLASINCQSLEKLVIDNEVCGSAYRLIEGISLETDSVITDLIDSVGPGGHFLGQKHTREHLRKEHLIPSDVVCRLSPEIWRREGSRDSTSRARGTVQRVLAEHSPDPLPSEANDRLERAFKEIVQKYGISDRDLPPIP